MTLKDFEKVKSVDKIGPSCQVLEIDAAKGAKNRIFCIFRSVISLNRNVSRTSIRSQIEA